MKKVVAIGGGTGLSTLIKGLKEYDFDISAIVTMTDDGLSSGRLRRDFGILPPGDIRKCIIALSNEEALLTKLFEYRFKRGKGLTGHSLGNLLILALEKCTGSFKKAIESASKILAIKGKVIPSSFENINLVSIHKSGKKVIGERKSFLVGKKDPIVRVELEKTNVTANPEAIKSIKNADLILIGPGSLYTSVIPNLLIKSITQAILNNRKATKIFVCNVSTERGETQGYTVDDHLAKLIEHSKKNIINYCLVNNKIVKSSQNEHKLGEIRNISSDRDNINGIKIIKADVIKEEDPLYHDSKKLSKLIWRLSNEK